MSGSSARCSAIFRSTRARTVGAVCEFYGLPAPANPSLPLGEWMVTELRRAPVAGDVVHIGHATLAVREIDAGRISRIGLGLDG